MRIVFDNSNETLVSIENAKIGHWYILSDLGNSMNGMLFYCSYESNARTKVMVSICTVDTMNDIFIEGKHYDGYKVWKEVKQTVTVTVG